MKTLTVQIPLSDDEALLLATKYQVKELEGLVIREGLHVLGALVTEVRNSIPYIETLEKEELFND